MSNYFKKIPNFRYTSLLENSKIGDKIEVKNLFKRAKLRNDIFNDLSLFEKYFIIGDERPDQVAFKFYDNSDLDWVILITNNILNIQSEWPMSQKTFNDYLLDKYGSYQKINEIKFYESKKVVDSNGVEIYPAGIIVSESHRVEFFDSKTKKPALVSDATRPITNYIYEERIQEQKRSIFILKGTYLNLVFNDFKEIMTYKNGSTDYISRTLKDTEDNFY